MIDSKMLAKTHSLCKKLDGYYFKIICGIDDPLMFELLYSDQLGSLDHLIAVFDNLDDLLMYIQDMRIQND